MAASISLLSNISEEAVTTIRPSIPNGRLATVADIVPACIFLASDEAQHFVGHCLSRQWRGRSKKIVCHTPTYGRDLSASLAVSRHRLRS